jgi:hypothetical protein
MEETERLLEVYIKSVWKTPELLHSLMLSQKRLALFSGQTHHANKA